jgi:hypothetical protein
MFIARMRGSRPDTIDKTELLHVLEPEKSRSTDQFLFTGTKWDQSIQAIAHGSDWLFIRQQWKAMNPLHPIFSQLNKIGCHAGWLPSGAGISRTLFLYTHTWIVACEPVSVKVLKSY